MQEKAIGGRWWRKWWRLHLPQKPPIWIARTDRGYCVKNTQNGGGGGSSEDSTLSIYFEGARSYYGIRSEIKNQYGFCVVSAIPMVTRCLVSFVTSLLLIKTGLALSSEDMNTVSSTKVRPITSLNLTSELVSAVPPAKTSGKNARFGWKYQRKSHYHYGCGYYQIEQPMALNYTSDTILVAGGPAKISDNSYNS